MSRAFRDPALKWLGVARAAFGLVFLARTTPLLAPLHLPFLAPAWPLLGWPDGGWHVPAFGLALPGVLVAALCLARTACAIALVLGVGTRVAGIGAGVAGYLVLSQDVFGYFHHLHMLYLGAILLGVTDSGSRFALAPAAPRSPATSVLLVRAWVASIYAWAALARLRPDWLDGRALEQLQRQRSLDGRLVEVLLATAERRAAVAWLVALGELVLAAGLLVPRTRRLALVGALLFHALNEAVARVDSIGWQMAALLLVFAGSCDQSQVTESTASKGHAINA